MDQHGSTASADEATEPAGPAPRLIRPRWAGALLVCGKCVKRCPNGKALRRRLKDGARQRAAEGREARPGKAKVRVVTTACLGLCPKRALVVASPATLAAGEVILLRSEAEAAAALPRLLPALG